MKSKKKQRTSSVTSSRTRPVAKVSIRPDGIRRALTYGLVAYAVALAAKLLVYPAWSQDPAIRFGGEYIMNTPDAYHWLAAAVGVGVDQNNPLALLARYFTEWTGLPATGPGFWLPVFLSSLVATITALWAWTLGAAEAGLCAGALAALTPGFFGRSHLGFYDSDMVTLLFPLVVAWALAAWLQQYLRPEPFLPARLANTFSKALGASPTPDAVSSSPGLTPRQALFLVATGVFARFANLWHVRIGDLNLALFFIALGLLWLRGKPALRKESFWGLLLFGLSAFLGWPGLFFSLVIVAVLTFRHNWFSLTAQRLWLGLVVLLLILLSFDLEFLWHMTWYYFERYLAPVAPVRAAFDEGKSLLYPSLALSVSETGKLGLEFLKMLHVWSWPAALGIVSSVIVFVLRPAALLLLPLALLGLAGFSLGARMAMFMSAACGLGLALPMSWFCRWLVARTGIRARWCVISQIVLTLLLIWPCFSEYAELPPKPALTSQMASALESLRRHSEPDSMVWIWWDYGYVANYFARRQSFADGGNRNNIGFIYPLSLALGTTNPLLSSQFIAYNASRQRGVWPEWENQSPEHVHTFLDDLGAKERTSDAAPAQYLVVALEFFDVLDWILHYATWDFRSRSSTGASVMTLEGTSALDTTSGRLVEPGRRGGTSLRSVDLLRATGSRRYDYPTNTGPRLVVNELAGKSYLLDERAYSSLAVRLLLCAPDDAEIGKHFALKYEGFPFVRIYQVR